MLNATLTVESGLAGSHQNKGWEQFTDAIIETISTQCNDIVFLLWGNYAKQKGKRIDRDRHLVLTSGHPSPLSANRGLWFGNRHFSKANNYLTSKGKSPVDW
jgi:uracil-DNA glycosylase